MAAIPERSPIGDAFSGVVVQSDGRSLLAVEPQPDTDVLARGALTIRYGVRFLGKPHVSIVPGLVVLDYGDILTGDEAWNFLLKRSNLHPRAEVIGYRNDGTDDMILVRALDLAIPVEVLVYLDAVATVPVAKPDALIAPQTAELPPRLLQYLPRFGSLAEWKASSHE